MGSARGHAGVCVWSEPAYLFVAAGGMFVDSDLGGSDSDVDTAEAAGFGVAEASFSLEPNHSSPGSIFTPDPLGQGVSSFLRAVLHFTVHRFPAMR